VDLAKTFGDAILTAEQAWRAAEHILLVTFPVVQDSKLLLRVLEHLDKAARTTISTVLKLEYLYKRVRLSGEGARNKELFRLLCSHHYKVSEEDAILLSEVLDLGKRHRSSGVELSQRKKVVILDDNFGSVEITAPHLQQISQAIRRLQLQLQRKVREFGEPHASF